MKTINKQVLKAYYNNQNEVTKSVLGRFVSSRVSLKDKIRETKITPIKP